VDGYVTFCFNLGCIQGQKENRGWYDCEVDDETAYCDWNGAGPSKQVPEDSWTYERHGWRGSGQRGQCAGACSQMERDADQQETTAYRPMMPTYNATTSGRS